MNKHVHYDLAALERQMTAEFGAVQPVDEFHRHQIMGTETVVKFGVCMARFDNEGLTGEQQVAAGASIIASLVQNLAESFDGDTTENVIGILNRVAEFAIDGGETVSMVSLEPVDGGHA